MPADAPARLVLPPATADDPVVQVVAWARRVLFKHPAAAQATYRALIAEGRLYAKTEEGAAWRARLDASETLRRMRPLWEVATVNLLEAEGSGAIPGQFIELLAQALSRADLEALTAALSEAPPPPRSPR